MSEAEREIEQGIATLEAIKVHIDNIQKQIATIDLSIQEHDRAIDTMENYSKMEDEEILVPVGAGVFIGARVRDKKALITIGNSLYTELPPEEIVDKLKKRKEDLEKLKAKLTEDLYKLEENYALLSAQVEENYRKYIEERKNVQTP